MNKLDLINLSTISVNKDYLEHNENFTKEIIIRNRSERDIFNIVVKNSISEGTSFEGTGVRINGREEVGNHPALGINVIKLSKGEDVSIGVNLRCLLKNGGVIKNDVLIEYQYYDYDLDKYITLRKNIIGDNQIVNEANFNNLSLKFEKNSHNLDINEKMDIFLEFYNSGNISANNVVLSIHLPSEIKRASEEVYINNEKYLLNKGLKEICIGKIDPLEKVSIKFICEGIKRTPTEGTIITGNIFYETFLTPTETRRKKLQLENLKVIVSSPKLDSVITLSNGNPIVSDIVDVVIKINNTGNVDALKGRVFIDLPSTVSLCSNFIEVDSEMRDSSEIVKGISIKKFDIHEEKEISFKVKCTSFKKEHMSVIDGRITYEYEDGENSRYKEEKIPSKSLVIDEASCQMKVKGSKSKVVLEDEIIYKIYLENTGSLELLNLFLKASLTKGLEFVNESIRIDGKLFEIGNIVKGICIGNVGLKELIQIEFKVKVIGIGMKPLEVNVLGNFQYRNKNLNIKRKEIMPISNKIDSGIALFKSFSMESLCKLPRHMPGIKEVLEFSSSVTITEYYPILSLGNNRNNKLIVNGYVEDKIEYISDEVSENIYLTTNKTNFSNFIVLPMEYAREQKIDILTSSKNEYTRIQNNNELYILNLINIEGRIIN